MALPYQAILLIAFGGPTCPEEIRPFLRRVTRGVPIPPARLEEVAHHYEAVGGKSPLNEITLRQATALQQRLRLGSKPLPVYVGMRNSEPSFAEALKQMRTAGISQALGLVLSAHRSEASWERYQKNIAEARAKLGDAAPAIDFCSGWYDHPLFIQCWRELIDQAFASIASERRKSTSLIFTAHSLPMAMAAHSPYVDEVQTSARLIAQTLDREHWSLAYQSRSGKPDDLWLEPDIAKTIQDLAARGVGDVVVAPLGFVCDHVEVLYDLDIEAKRVATDLGMHFIRASCPNDHPTFIRMMAEIIQAKLNDPLNRG